MKPFTIVTASDSNYYHLLKECVLSIRKHFSREKCPVSILDAGLNESQLKDLALCDVNDIKKGEWNFNIANYKIKNKEFLKSMTCLPFLPEYFPGYETYIFVDADTWLNDPFVINLLIRAASEGKIGICPQADRGSGRLINVEWFLFFPRIRSIFYKNAKRALSLKIAKELATQPVLNTGVFSLRYDAPHWDTWKKNMELVLKKGRVFTSDQLSLAMTIYLDKFEAELLPLYCNWITGLSVKYDKKNRIFVEPYLPNHPIGFMHLAGDPIMRNNSKPLPQIEIKDLDGNLEKRTLRFAISR